MGEGFLLIGCRVEPGERGAQPRQRPAFFTEELILRVGQNATQHAARWLQPPDTTGIVTVRRNRDSARRHLTAEAAEPAEKNESFSRRAQRRRLMSWRSSISLDGSYRRVAIGTVAPCFIAAIGRRHRGSR